MATLSPSARALAPWLLLAGLASPPAAELPPEVEEELDRLAEVFEGYEEFTATYAMRSDGEESVLTIGYRADEGIVMTVESADGGVMAASAIDGVMLFSDSSFWGSYDIGLVFDDYEEILDAMGDLGLDVEAGRFGPGFHLHVSEDDFDIEVVWSRMETPFCVLGDCRRLYDEAKMDEQAVSLKAGRTTLRLARDQHAGFPISATKSESKNGLELLELEHQFDPDLFEMEEFTDGRENRSAELCKRLTNDWRNQRRKLIHSKLSTGLEEGAFDISESEDEVLDIFELWYAPILTELFEGWPDQLSTWVVETAGRIDELAGDDADSRERQVEMLEKQTTEALESAAQSAFGSLEGGWDHFREEDLLELEAEAARRVFERIVSEPVLLTLEGQIDWLLDR